MPVSGLLHAVAIDFDPVNKFVWQTRTCFWSCDLMTYVGIHADTFFNALTNMNIRRLANTFDLLVIQQQPGPVVLELVSLVEGGQGVGLNRGVAIFVFFAHFFQFSFRFFVHIFSLWHVFLYSHPWAFTASRDFCDNAFLVYVVTGVLARYLGILIPPQVFWIFVPRKRHFSIVLGTFSALFWLWSSILHFQLSWTLSWLLSRNWAFFTFWAKIKHFNFISIFHMLNAISTLGARDFSSAVSGFQVCVCVLTKWDAATIRKVQL